MRSRLVPRTTKRRKPAARGLSVAANSERDGKSYTPWITTSPDFPIPTASALGGKGRQANGGKRWLSSGVPLGLRWGTLTMES